MTAIKNHLGLKKIGKNYYFSLDKRVQRIYIIDVVSTRGLRVLKQTGGVAVELTMNLTHQFVISNFAAPNFRKVNVPL